MSAGDLRSAVTAGSEPHAEREAKKAKAKQMILSSLSRSPLAPREERGGGNDDVLLGSVNGGGKSVPAPLSSRGARGLRGHVAPQRDNEKILRDRGLALA
jgi:hypothetical protein